MTDSFDIFWKAYPRKVGKKPAEAKFHRAVKKAGLATIMAGLEKWKAVWIGTEPQFIPHATTWLNQERWNDTPDTNGKQEGTLPRRIEALHPITAAFAALDTMRAGQPLDSRERQALREWDGPVLQRRAARLGLTLP